MYAAIESDGELYKMQQEAIRRARETARRSMDYGAGPSRPDSAPAPQYISDPQPQHAPAPEHMPPAEEVCAPRPQKRNGLLRRPDFIDRVGHGQSADSGRSCHSADGRVQRHASADRARLPAAFG